MGEAATEQDKSVERTILYCADKEGQGNGAGAEDLVAILERVVRKVHQEDQRGKRDGIVCLFAGTALRAEGTANAKPLRWARASVPCSRILHWEPPEIDAPPSSVVPTPPWVPKPLLVWGGIKTQTERT